jgi:hypothetical protein
MLIASGTILHFAVPLRFLELSIQWFRFLHTEPEFTILISGCNRSR